jgi:hypothetical protein
MGAWKLEEVEVIVMFVMELQGTLAWLMMEFVLEDNWDVLIKMKNFGLLLNC